MKITNLQKYCIGIFLLASFLLLWNLDYAPFWNPDEGRYAAAALEMVQPFPGEASSWIIPHLNTLPRLNKPPLVYWITASAYEVFGIHTWSGRLASALASIGILAALWWMALAVWGREKGSKKAFFAMLVWVTAAVPFSLSRVLNTDMLLTLTTAVILMAIWRTTEEDPPWSAFVVAAIGFGMALLAKGPVGVALPLMVVLAWMLLARRKYFLPYFAKHGIKILLVFAAGIAIAAPWYLAVNEIRPGFLKHFIFVENLGRFSGEKAYHKPTSIFYYAPIVFIGLFPWTFFLWPAAVNCWKGRFAASSESRARLFLWVWALLIVVFFSLSSTKLITYILPALPAFALLLGDAASEYRLPSRAWRFAMAASIALVAIFGVVFLLFPVLEAAHKVASVTALRGTFWAGGGVLTLGALAMLWLRKTPRLKLAAQSVTALIFVAILPFCVGRVAPYEDVSTLLKDLEPLLLPDDQIMQYRSFGPTAIFYARRPVTVIADINTSGYNKQEYQESALFPQNAAIIDTVADAPHRIFVMVRWKFIDTNSLKELYYWGANNDVALLSNRPAPAGWPIEYIASAKRERARQGHPDVE